MSKTITIALGEKKGNVQILPLMGLDDIAIGEALNFDLSQRIYLKVTGLKKDGKTVDVSKRIEGFGYFSSDDCEKLEEGATYELVFDDTRKADASKLTEEEKKKLKQEFAGYDVDQNGLISMEEVKKYYDAKLQKTTELYKKITEMKIKEHPSQQETLNKKLADQLELAAKANETAYKRLVEADLDKSGSISWDEFVNQQAPAIVRNRK